MGLITREQLDECAKISEQVSSAGLPKSVNQVLIEKRYLTQRQLNAVLQSLGKALGEIGPYEVLSKLGEGGMGAVYKVRHKTTGKLLALKTLRRDLARDREYLERFQREVKNTMALSHPNIVGAADAGSDKGMPWFAMEFVEGESVERMIERKGRIEERESARLVIQIAAALPYAAERHIVHRDIKPANIMVTPDGVAKLCDLGIAKSMEAGSTLTQTGSAVGSPYYISPEQAKGEKQLDVRSDIYSLGVTLFRMVTGKVPFEAENAHAVVMKRLTDNPPPPRAFAPELTMRMDSVILKMLMRDPAHRYQTPAEVAADLAPVAEGSSESSKAISLPHLKKPVARTTQRHHRPVIQKKSPLPLIVGGAIGLIVVILLATVLPGLLKTKPPTVARPVVRVPPKDPPQPPKEIERQPVKPPAPLPILVGAVIDP